MMRLLPRIGLALALLIATLPAWGSVKIGAPISIGTHAQATSSTNAATTVNNCAAGGLIVLSSSHTSGTLQSVADGTNTWVVVDNIAGTSINLGAAYTITPAAFNAGATITATYSGSTTSTIIATCISGIQADSPLDVSGKTQQGTAATAATSVSTGTLARPNEVLIGLGAWASTTSGQVPGGQWTQTQSIATAPGARVDTQFTGNTSSVAFAPTWATASNYVTDVLSFKVLAATPIPYTIGVGSTTNGAGSYAITTTADCPAHSDIGVLSTASTANTPAVSATVDSASNSYAVVDTSATVGANNNRLDFWMALNTAADLPSGGTITITYGTTGNRAALFCIAAIGQAGIVDVHNQTAAGNGASPATTVTTGSPPFPVGIVLGLLTINNNALTPVVTPAGSFILLSSSLSTVQTAYAAFLILGNVPVASQSWSPTWTQATTGYNTAVLIIRGISPGAGLMMGAGGQ